MMDHAFQRQMFRPYFIPNHVRLTSFQLPSSNLMPGMGLAVSDPALMIPLHSESLYNHTKQLELKPEVAAKAEPQTIEENVQQGRGKIEDNSEENSDDIDFNSSKAVSQNILNAFDKPVMRTAIVHYQPAEVSNVGKKPKKSAKISKLKFV